MKATTKDPNFLLEVTKAKEGDVIEVDGAKLTLVAKFDVPTHFNFHQRIFPAGAILKKEGSNARIYVPAALIGIKPKEVKPGEFDDKQKKADGTVLPVDPAVQGKAKK